MAGGVLRSRLALTVALVLALTLSNICRFLFYWTFDRIARVAGVEGQGAGTDVEKGKGLVPFVLRSLDEPKVADQCEVFGRARSRPDEYIGMI